MFAGTPPDYMKKEKVIKLWRQQQSAEAERIWNTLSCIDFDTDDVITCQAFAGGSVSRTLYSAYVLCLKTDRVVRVSANGVYFTASPKGGRNAS